MADAEMRILVPEMGNAGLSAQRNFELWNRFWYAIDSFLMAGGNVSKAFWPVLPKKPTQESERSKLRGQELRRILEVADSSLFSYKNRTMRNHFEHFDERLDNWFYNAPNRSVTIDSSIVPLFQIEISKQIVGAETFRAFDRDAWTLHCVGDTLNFNAVLGEVTRLQTSLDAHSPGMDFENIRGQAAQEN